MGLDLEDQRRTVLETAARLTEARQLHGEGLQLLEKGKYSQAGDRISRAAEMGDSTAQCQLGHLHENGFFGEPDPGEAVRWYRKSAEQFLPHGQFQLGVCYQLGKGVKQDREEAARLFDQAARRGHHDAAECLLMLRDTSGNEPVAAATATLPKLAPLPPELDEPAVGDAVAAYQAQALQNQARAQLQLGLAYHVGRSVARNPKLACFWVMRSIVAGDSTAAQYLPQCIQSMTPEEHLAVQAKVFTWAPGQPVPRL